MCRFIEVVGYDLKVKCVQQVMYLDTCVSDLALFW